MKRHLPCLLAALALLYPPLPTRAAGDAPERLRGRWQAVEAEIGGQKLPPAAARAIRLTIGRRGYEVTTADGVDRGTCLTDSRARPRRIKIQGTDGPNDGKTFLAIYRLEDRKLRICYDLSGRAYPTRFSTSKENGRFLVTYRRLRRTS